MINKISLIILTIFLYLKGNSQFIVLPPEQARADYFHTLIPQTNSNQFKFLQYRDNNFTSQIRVKHQILTYDLNGNFIDSTNIQKGFSPISFPLINNNTYYWPSLYLDTTISHPNTKNIFILKFDNAFNCISKKRLVNTANSEEEWPSNIIKINHHLYLSIENLTNNYLKIYKIDTLCNKIDSVFFNAAHVVEMRKSFDDNLVIAGYGFPPLNMWGGSYSSKIIMDTNLITKSTFFLDSLTYVTAGGTVITGCSSQIGIYPTSMKVLPITSNKNLIMGHHPIIYNNNCDDKEGLVHCVIDNNNKIQNTSIISTSIRNTTYLDITNFVEYKNNYIYTVGTEGYSYQAGFMQPQHTSILVCKLDTMGNLVWKKSYGDDMFYRPVSIIQTLDSGLLVSGLRYNQAETSYPGVGQSFILRLDKNGDFVSVGIKENSSANFNSVKCYPNPTNDIIYFDVPFITQYKIEMYDIFGKLVYQNDEYNNLKSISTISLSSGAYFYKIKIKENQITGKFIKE